MVRHLLQSLENVGSKHEYAVIPANNHRPAALAAFEEAREAVGPIFMTVLLVFLRLQPQCAI
jgi:hypothetical protein